MASALTKSKLIARIAITYTSNDLSTKDVELAIKALIDYMADAMVEGERIEIRGFGSFSLHFRAPRVGRNPKTGASVELQGKYVPHFKCGKDLRERVNRAMQDDDGGDHNEHRSERRHHASHSAKAIRG